MACLECGDSRVSWVPADGPGFPAHWELEGSGYDADPIEVRFCPFCGAYLWNYGIAAAALWGVERFAEWLGRESLLEKAREAKKLESKLYWDSIYSGWANAHEWHFIRTGWRLL